MVTQYKQRNLEVRYIDEINDYGVFTNEFIKKGELVETCYLIKIELPSSIPSYSHLIQDKFVLPLGYGSIYNHNETPNLILKSYDEKHIQFYSIKDIEPNTELCYYFNKRFSDIKPKTGKSII